MQLVAATIACLMGFLLFPGPICAQTLPRSVLILQQENQSRVWNFDLENTLRTKLNTAPGPAVRVYADNLDLAQFSGQTYEASLRNFLREKYRGVPIGVIVVNGTRALDLTLSLRADLWPLVPIVFACVDDETAARMNGVSNVTGHIMRLTLKDMIATARLLTPSLRRIALVGDPFEKNTFFRGFLTEIPHYSNELEIINLTGLSMANIKTRVAALPEDAVIGYTTLTVDGAGVAYLPREAIAEIAQVANRPIVTNTVNFIGYGVVGGNLVSAGPIGEQAGRTVLRILEGEAASNIPISLGDFSRPIFDWRELQRWGVSVSAIPQGSELRFRTLTAWEQYRWQIVAIAMTLMSLSMLLARLLLERSRRQAAEMESRQRLFVMTHMNRAFTVGAMSSSIAHELNQPLSAILTNAEAAELLLSATVPDMNQIKEIVADIRRDDRRAASIIGHLHGMLKKNELEATDVDLTDAVNNAVEVLAPEAKKRGVTLEHKSNSGRVVVRADAVHLQQVLVNLAVNGMDAMEDCLAGTRRLIYGTAILDDSTAVVSVRDTGVGIPEGRITSIFDPFVTTKKEGIGLGLLIVSTIVKEHGGRIWAENMAKGGAMFQFTLPLAVHRRQ